MRAEVSRRFRLDLDEDEMELLLDMVHRTSYDREQERELVQELEEVWGGVQTREVEIQPGRLVVGVPVINREELEKDRNVVKPPSYRIEDEWTPHDDGPFNPGARED